MTWPVQLDVNVDLSDSERYSGRRRRVHVRGRTSDGSYLRELVGSPCPTVTSCDAAAAV